MSENGPEEEHFLSIYFFYFLILDADYIVANQSVINPSVASLVTCNDILQASAGVCHVPDGLVMPDAGQMTGTTCQSCVITFSDKKSYEQNC